MFEAGIKFERIQRHFKYKTKHIVGCLTTHEHGDHAKYTKQSIDNGVISYMTARTQRAMDFESHRLCTTKTKQELRIDTWSILPLDVEHDANEPMAFLLQSTLNYKVLYVTDTKHLEYKFNDITHMMSGVNYIYEQMRESIKNDSVRSTLAGRIMESRFSPEHTIGMLKANDLARLEETHLVCLSSQNSNAKYIKNEIQKVTDASVYIGGL